ncbi:SCO4983 family protein [Streptomyces coelicoflavus]|uniref:SCO4983 family protein n=1 Tax=Streptomyces coelicoflavus TaxID=285562 RepID=UPI0036D04BAD
MYEPIRSKSVHSTMADGTTDVPRRSRDEELDIQLAGHLAALLAVTDELRALAPGTDLDTAADRLAGQVTRLRGGQAPARLQVAVARPEPCPATLHRRAHTLAARALVVAASRADTAVAILTAERMDAHAAALEPRELASR